MRSDREIQIRAARDEFNIFSGTIKLACIEHIGKQISAASSLLMNVLPDGECVPAFVTIDKEQAQLLMDDLWICGIRPSEGTGSAGSLKATQDHLADLKKILFHKLGIKE